MDGLNTVLEYLTSVPAWYLATSVDGQPHVRPFSFAQIQDGTDVKYSKTVFNPSTFPPVLASLGAWFVLVRAPGAPRCRRYHRSARQYCGPKRKQGGRR